jgi:replicative superfamily II helicase
MEKSKELQKSVLKVIVFSILFNFYTFFVNCIVQLDSFYRKELGDKEEILSKYKSICEMYEKQHYRDSMIIKFRDSTIKKLSESHSFPHSHLQSLQSQLDSLTKDESARLAHEQAKVRELKKALQKEENYEELYRGLLKVLENSREREKSEGEGERENDKDVTIMVRH